MDVPALTVHDEFIVPVDMVEAVHEVRHRRDLKGFGDREQILLSSSYIFS